MHEKRYVRFGSIAGIEVPDLPVAAEVWLDDLSKSSWVTRDITKIASLCVRYMQAPDPNMLRLQAIERTFGLDKVQVLNNLRLMVIYGAMDSYEADTHLRASLTLSFLQRLRVLEVKARYAELLQSPVAVRLPWQVREEKWVLKNAVETVED